MAKNTSGLRPPWKPGQTGNPKGYNNLGRWRKEWEKFLKKHPEAPQEWFEALHAAIIGKKLIDQDTGVEREKPNIRAIELGFDRVYGKVLTNVAISGMGMNPGREGQRFNEILNVPADDPDNT